MDFTSHDRTFLERALQLAREAAAFASPNPTVGCVLVRDGAAIGEGAHRYAERDHAEIIALKQAAAAANSTSGTTAYVTLEPCSHHGRTGPCADALIRAGIRRCVVATVDPNPRVRGAGVARMRAAGIEVLVVNAGDTIARKAQRLNDAFAFSIQHGRPFVTLKAAVSLDGKLAPAASTRATREPWWLTGMAARADVQRLRHGADAVLTGIGTVLADDPSLTDRSRLPRARALLRCILDSDLRTPTDAKILYDAKRDVVLFSAAAAQSEKVNSAAFAGAEVVPLVEVEPGALDLLAALRVLDARGVRGLLLECGSTLNGAWLRAGLVDRVILYIADVGLGDDALPFAEGGITPYSLQETLSDVRRTTFPSDASGKHDDVRIEGYMHDPWTGV